MALNKQGGFDYKSKEKIKRAEKVDLLTLPKKVEGTNCANCQFIKIKDKELGIGFCQHPEVLLEVTERQCCALWNSKGSLRSWEDK